MRLETIKTKYGLIFLGKTIKGASLEDKRTCLKIVKRHLGEFFKMKKFKTEMYIDGFCKNDRSFRYSLPLSVEKAWPFGMGGIIFTRKTPEKDYI